jgi:hypothetical protein
VDRDLQNVKKALTGHKLTISSVSLLEDVKTLAEG